MNTEITKSRFALTSIALTLLALLALTGCSGGAAEHAAGAADDDAAARAAIESDRQEAARAEEERQLAARQRELDRRAAELERREAETAQRQSGARSSGTPAQRPAPRAVPAADPQPRSVTLTVPTTTAIQVEFLEPLSSEESLVGDPVRVAVVEDVVQDGVVAIPAGSLIEGTVAEVKKGKKVGGRAKLNLDFTTLRLPAGEPLALRASLELLGKSQTGKDAATIGGATAGGAILGRVVGGDDKTKSTAIGAVVGAAVGTAVAANNKATPVLVESGQTTELLLYEPLELTLLEPTTIERVARNR